MTISGCITQSITDYPQIPLYQVVLLHETRNDPITSFQKMSLKLDQSQSFLEMGRGRKSRRSLGFTSLGTASPFLEKHRENPVRYPQTQEACLGLSTRPC